jgi:tetratricopeptide (TPR) repeat protein
MRNRPTKLSKLRMTLPTALGVMLLGIGAPDLPAQAQPSTAKSSQSKSPLSEAKAQLSKDDLAGAEKTLWPVLSSDPNNEEALTLLGIVRGRQERFPEAEALFRRALQINPKSLVAVRNLANALLAQDKADEAIEQYKQAEKLAPQDAELKTDLARLYIARGNFADALSELNQVPSARLPAEAIAMKAASLIGVGKKSEAEVLANQTKGNIGIAMDLAEVYVTANLPDAALRALKQPAPAAKKFPARYYQLLGQALRQKGDMTAALAAFRQAAMEDPKSADPLMGIAEIYANQQRPVESLAALEKARALSPDSPLVLRAVIIEAMQVGHNAEALAAAEQLPQHSKEPQDIYLAASVMVQEKRYTPASHLLEDYTEQRADDPKGFLALGMAYLGLLHYPEARKALEHSIELDPRQAEAAYQLGQVAAQQGDRSEAIQHLERAVQLQPNHAKALFTLGTFYLESGDLDKAEATLTRSAAADPTNPKTEYDLGLVLNKMGKTQEAKEHMEKYHRLEQAEQGAPGAGQPKTE